MFNLPYNSHAKDERLELLKAWLGTTVAFTILLGGRFSNPRQLLILALISTITAGLGIILHELAHRAVARRFGCSAHFVANDAMLVFSVLIAFTGFLILAPGAVWHSGMITKKQSGQIAAAGPATNIVLALLFLGLALLPLGPQLVRFAYVGYQINSWLALFNMSPFHPIDGAKILDWDTVTFAVMAGIGLFLVFGVPRIIPLL